jgi:hypothetical protein
MILRPIGTQIRMKIRGTRQEVIVQALLIIEMCEAGLYIKASYLLI